MDVNNPAMKPIARDFQFADLAPSLDTASIEEVILVQAAATENETDYLLSLADKHNEIAGVVGWSNIEVASATAVLERWATHLKFKGIRPMLQDIDATEWLITAPHSSVWGCMKELGLRLDALVQPRHLQMLNNFCRAHESIPVVIDHAAKPKQAFAGDQDAFNVWAKEMALLGANAQVYCKLSGLFTELTAEAMSNPQPIIKPALEVLLEHFGPSRLMWGSDWPVLTLASSYEEWDAVATQMLNELSENEKHLILGETAAQFYGLGATV